MEGALPAVVVAGLGAALAWGCSDVLSAKATRASEPLVAAFWINAIGAIAFAAWWLLWSHAALGAPQAAWLYAMGAGLVFGLSEIVFFRALGLGPVVLVVPLSSTYPLATMILAIAVFNVRLSPGQTLGVLLIVGGIILASGLAAGTHRLLRQRGPLLGLATAALWGLGYSLMARAIPALGWETATLIELVVTVLGFILFRPLVSRHRISTLIKGTRRALPYLLGAGLIQLIGELLINLGLQSDPAGGSITTAISSCYPVITMAAALVVFRERVRPLALAGALIAVLGIVILVTLK